MDITITIFSIIVLLFSIIIHEVAHGSTALYLGDPTAKYSGRLTLNPLKHLDPFGSVLLPLALLFITNGQGPVFGWTKPVPVNPYNFRDQKWGVLKVSISGPATNFFIAVIFSLLIRFFSLPSNLMVFFSIVALYNFAWGIFNLVPIPPLDGYHIFFSILPDSYSNIKTFLIKNSLILLFLFIILGGFSLVFLGASFLYGFTSGL
jgi:Zn-dependent protease